MIEIKNLHFSYKKKKVFNGISLSFASGHIYGLLGKNGTGKTTLLKNIVGSLFPADGALDVMGYEPGKRQAGFLQNVFLVPEEFFLPDVAIEKFVRCNAPFYPKFSMEQFDKYLTEFEIPRDNRLQQMSYGQKKKVLISFALACNTMILLMDEPSNGLDVMSKSQFRKVIAGAIDETKCIIISTHQVKDIENLVDRITIIDGGEILFDHTVNEITSRLSFKLSFSDQEQGVVFYKEESLKGNAIVAPNLTGEDSKMDLEMLYKAVITNGKELRSAFAQSIKQ